MRRPSLPALVALVTALSVSTLSACTSGDPESPRERGATTEPDSSGRSELTPLTAPMRVAPTRWARGNVPRSVPEPHVPLPSLLNDLPGRALLASYVPRPAVSIDGEAIEFFGVDGRWRRLDLGDLDLPADGWSGGDTYGAGALSPNGRWWAGPMRDGMFLVDLRDGSTKVRRVAGIGGMASFKWSPDSDELVLIVAGQSTRVSVPGMAVQPFPRPTTHPTWIVPSLLTKGGWVECPHHRRMVARCNTYGADGALVDERSIPEDLRKKWAGPSDVLADSVFYSLPPGPFGNVRRDWEVLRTDADFRADARLVLPAKSEINGVDTAINSNALGLAALSERLLLAWLVDERAIVKVIRPGIGLEDGGQDFWGISYARDLVTIH